MKETELETEISEQANPDTMSYACLLYTSDGRIGRHSWRIMIFPIPYIIRIVLKKRGRQSRVFMKTEAVISFLSGGMAPYIMLSIY